MAEKYALAATAREMSKQSARETRATGRVPGVIYGHGVDNQHISVDYSEFLKLFRRSGQASVIDLSVDGKSVPVLVHEYLLDPVQDTFQHIDFYAVNMKEATTVHVPLVFHGESEAVKSLGGTFMVNHESIEIRCLPADIPHDIQVDISGMAEIHAHISINDLNLPDNLELMHMDPETVICSIIGRAAEEDLDAPIEDPMAEEKAAAEAGEEGEASAEEGGEEAKAE